MAKFLVTGAGGFIGSHLCEQLISEGHSVRAFVRYTSTSSEGWLGDSPHRSKIEFFRGDIRDFDSVSKSLDGVEGVYHLAALIGIPYSYESPMAYLKTNIEGTYNVLEAAKAKSTGFIAVTSTSEVYGTARFTPITEEHPLQPQSPYSATKIAADSLALSYYNSFELPVTIVRPFNTFGPRQSDRAIIPTIINQLLRRNDKILLGSLSPIRDFTFVHDTVRAISKIPKIEAFRGKAVNIGSGKGVSMGALYDIISQIIGHRAEIVEDKNRMRPENSEVFELLCSADLLKSKSDWSPESSLEEGLKQTIEWFKKNVDKYPDSHYRL
ncbi:MAG: NAD-dependent dehydratase [Bdellovibrionales bacterium CG10_big_fil_rev_8_21_14_0_10_45_34]|nr:MAG: NAD-dependent dehydratase [Bdellovibrionales bacterium CG10_big_fil_rev_8_21_14_0_10_45_34]